MVHQEMVSAAPRCVVEGVRGAGHERADLADGVAQLAQLRRDPAHRRPPRSGDIIGPCSPGAVPLPSWSQDSPAGAGAASAMAPCRRWNAALAAAADFLIRPRRLAT